MNNIYHLYGRLNQLCYASMVGDTLIAKIDGEIRYIIKDKQDLLNIYDPNNELIADNLTPDNVVDFIRNDIPRIYRNDGGFITKIEGHKRTVKLGEEPTIKKVLQKTVIDEKTERIIRSAASKHGVTDVDNFLKKMRSNKNRDVGKTKKSKRKIDIEELELE